MEELNKELLLDLYHSMVRIRMFEERVRDLALKNEIPGFVHVSIGEEASATGVCLALRHTDRITSTHRGHGHLIAKGGRLDRMMAELYGKREGYCKGKGGSMHIVDFALGILGANGIVGAGLPIATGSALAAQIAGRDEVTACFFGDGNDVFEVYRYASEAIARARAGEGPTLLECKTYRWEGHVVGEQAFLGSGAYRAEKEIEEWKARCPLI